MIMINCLKPRVKVPYVFKEIYNPWRYKVMYGGRGSGKSQTTAQYLVQSILQEQRPYTYGCFRQIQDSLSESVKPLILACADEMGVAKHFKTSQTSAKIHCLKNGAKFVFSGLSNEKQVKKIKSMHGLKRAWIEEADPISEETWDIFTPSIRGSDDSEILVTFNPNRKSDYLYQTFVVNKPPPHSVVIKANYYDNPYFPQVLELERQACKIHPNKYRRIWLGHAGFVENQLLKPEWWRYYSSLAEVLGVITGMYITADTAYKEEDMHDYSVIQCWGYNGRSQLYLLAQIRGKWPFPTLVENMVAFVRKCCRFHRFMRPKRIFIEDKASGISLVQTLARKNLQAIAWKPRDYHFPQDKVGRVNESSLIISDNLVYLPEYAPWISAYVDEMSEFSETGSESFDDQVDATTMSISIWRSLGGGYKMEASQK